MDNKVIYVKLIFETKETGEEKTSLFLHLHKLIKKVKRNEKIEVREIQYGRFIGLELLFPFPKDDIKKYTENQFNCLVEEAIEKYNISKNTALLDGTKKEINISTLYFLFIKQILEATLIQKRIERRRARVLVIDSEDYKCEYIIKRIFDNLNFMTIATSEPDKYKELVNNIYTETGLIVPVVSDKIREKVDANIIINLQGNKNKNYNYFEDNAVVIDLVSERKWLNRIAGIKRNLSFFLGGQWKISDTYIDEQLLLEILLDNFNIARINNNSYEQIYISAFDKIIDNFELLIDNMKFS